MNRLLTFFLFILFSSNTFSQLAVITPAETSVCYGENAVILTLEEYTKTIKRWEMSTTGGSPWVSIANESKSLNVNNLTQKTWYRVVMQDIGGPEVYSSIATINVYSEAKTGIIVAPSSVCKGNNSGELTLIGAVGSVIRWEYSVDNVVWHKINTNEITHRYTNINKKTWYKATLKSGMSCAEVTTPSIAINVDEPTNPGVVEGGTAVCRGENAGTVTLNSSIGEVMYWETSPTGSSPWSVLNETEKSLSYTNILNTSWFRAVVKNGTCPANVSAAALVSVSEPTVGGITAGTTSVCSKENHGEISLAGHSGSVQKWQYSTNNGVNWRDTQIVATGIDYTNLTTTRIYRAVIKNGVCAEQMSIPSKVTVNPLPIIEFSAPSMPQGEAVSFSNTTTIAEGSVKQFIWDFGEGSSATARNPIHIYANAGIYIVRLEAISDKGCVDSLKKEITINEVPQVDFSFTNVCLKSKVKFINTSTLSDPAPSFAWDFGDGSPISTEENPEHHYSNPGEYNVMLSVSTSNTSAFMIKAVEVFHQATPDFEAASVCLGGKTSFINKSSIKEGNLMYNWFLGDGGVSGEINPTYTYSTTGTFTARLITVSNNNCRDTLYKNVYVNAVPQAMFTTSDVPYGTPVNLINGSSIEIGAYTSRWELGDGNTSTLHNLEHTYTTAGNFLVTLSLESDSGCTASYSKTVWIHPKPHAEFSMQPVCEYDSVGFENQSTISSGTMTYLWKFGDGTTSAQVHPKKRYSEAGTYTVTLIATSGNMGVDSVQKSITIHPVPIPNFTFQNVCDGASVNFQNESVVATGSITSYLWDFGDGSNAVRQSPVKQYLNPGSYGVVLQVLSDKGCFNQIAKGITIFENPTANFTVSSVCQNYSVLPQNLSVAMDGSNYQWDMGDGSVDNAHSASHKYAQSGLYSIKLKVTDLNGCSDSLQRNVNIYPLPNVNAGQDTSIVLGFPINLMGNGGVVFEWYPAEGLSSAFIQNPIASPKQTTTYYLTVSDQNGCVNRDSITIYVEDRNIIVASNILTPDANGENDTWYIQNIENYSNARITIVNRWGAVVFQTTGYKNDWNGTTKNKDILPDGTYYYIIEIPNKKVYKGAITILRNR